LAVTRDGFWGIIDTAKERLFLDEPDLVKMSAEEKDGDDFPKFGMLTSTAYTAKPPTPAPSSTSASPAGVTPDDRSPSIPLTRGEIFRILEDNGENLTIDFNSKFADHAPKPGSPAQPQLTVPSSRVASFRLSGEIVPREQLDQWRRGSAEYSVIFGSSFANLRVPALAIVRFGCGETTTLTQKNASNKEIKAGFEAGAGGSFWTWLKAKIDISGSISGQSSTAAESSFTDKSLRHGTMSPIEYRNGGGKDELFWAGNVQTCHSTPNWQTIAVRSGGEDHYLHNEMYQLGDDGKESPVGSMQNPTQPKLDGIEPGGNPFDTIQGIYKPKCFLQALNFQQLALQAMSAELPYRIYVAIAIKTSPQLGDLTRFYSDLGCGTAKTGA
jgi:hypothetical protein